MYILQPEAIAYLAKLIYGMQTALHANSADKM